MPPECVCGAAHFLTWPKMKSVPHGLRAFGPCGGGGAQFEFLKQYYGSSHGKTGEQAEGGRREKIGQADILHR
ncbi:hypothetical protein GPALN_013226 [Globodera pallida]|nr:hypothetical protein GPALN_013226 [Globodera pallida]